MTPFFIFLKKYIIIYIEIKKGIDIYEIMGR